ncbi:MAG: hypothetical protein ACETVN_00790 [Asgard group archaeon]
MRHEVQTLVVGVLGDVNTPMSINAICEKIFRQTKKKISWNTVYKYLTELVEFDKIRAISLPHSKIEGKEGLTVYILKK